jgi:hypothetical protein
MINFSEILKKAWKILWNYRILWVFGVLLAVTAGTAGGSSGSGYQFSRNDVNVNNGSWFNYPTTENWTEFRDVMENQVFPLFSHPDQHVTTWIWVGVGILLFFLVCAVINALIRYPSETALLRMVNEHEQTGIKMNFRQGWKQGWSRAAFRLWLIDLVLGLPMILFVLVLIGLGTGFFFSLLNSVDTGYLTAGEITMLVVMGIMVLFIFLYAIFMIFLRLLRQFFSRKAALENTTVKESLRQGWQTFTGDWKSACLMWLIMLGLGIGYGFGMVIITLILIPVFVLLLLPGVIVAAVPGLMAWGIASLFITGPWNWIIGLVVAAPFLGLVVGSPLILVQGWAKTLESSAWTLAYREIVGKKSEPVPSPKKLPKAS